MTTVTNNTVTGLQKRIARAMELKQDTSQLFRELRELRVKQEEDKEKAELQKVVDAHKALKDKAEKVEAKVRAQLDGIDRFLKLRDTLVKQLQPLLEPMSELAKMAASAWEREPGVCYSGFNDMGQFAAAIRQIPASYLPPDFGCPFLSMEGGEVDARGKAAEAYTYFGAALGILTSFQKGTSRLPLSPAEGLMEIDEIEAIETEADPYPDPPCKVCQHPQVMEINQAIAEGESLRNIAERFSLSKSTVDRHKQHIAAAVSQEG